MITPPFKLKPSLRADVRYISTAHGRRHERHASGRSQQELEAVARRRGYDTPLYYPPHQVAGTASNTIVAIDPRARVPESPRPAAAPVAVPRPPAAIGHERLSFKGGVIALTPVAGGARDQASTGCGS